MIDRPPITNGVMSLNESEANGIKVKPLQIQASFVPTENYPVLTTYDLVSKYNFVNPTLLINGDTADYLLSLSE